ncbi:polysaccharide lyase family 8 super-sandwich domain-containing protein [Catellatospora tritici]|uniref:polysaccharide lyase family 8 super-sandwich domain-containing protein n=1 Tax=Catellatospora tritici TaxID=2851566 RepID=UPI001C2DAB8F|nr:polysaccharide lyase family 8 super-sandwich domain-containing protein [Catellatospora tritici]MBV1851633.1 DNRLRE domain-containing protein [Catellatospora tritici]
MVLSRRDVLRTGGAGALGVLALPLLPAAPAFADEFDALRQRYRDSITGTGFSATAQPYATVLANIGASASTRRASMTPTAADLWPDLPLGTSSSVSNSYSRLKTMALAYVQPGTGLTGNATLLGEVVTGLDFLHGKVFNPSTTYYGNWWDWNIGSPQTLLDIMALIYSALTATQISNWLAAVDHFTPAASPLLNGGASTGANRIDVCIVLVRRGILGKNSTKVQAGRDGLSPLFEYVRTGDGIYTDGSFIQHGVVPYAGSYGSVLVGGLGGMLALLAGSTWAVSDPNQQIMFDAIDKAWLPFIFNGLMMDGVSGRAISRGLSVQDLLGIQGDDHVRGHSVTASIVRMADAAPAAQGAAWRSAVKGWIQREYWGNLADDVTMSIPGLAACLAVRDNAAITAGAEPVNHRLFAAMDRAVHRRATWAASLNLCSARTTYYETGNGENLRGWHTSNGMLYCWGDSWGNGQYSDAFWPTVDPYRLPGTTVSKKALADGAGGDWGSPDPGTSWVGGATDGTFAAIGQDTRSLQSTLQAKKSWFCLDDSIVCLGAGITAGDGVAIETTIDNRNLGGGTGTQTCTVDGSPQLTTVGSAATFTNASWAHNTFAGFVFPGGATFKGLRETRSGSWSQINTGGTTDVISRKYLTMWFDHGTTPSGASYSYLLLPGATTATTANRAANPTVSILANSGSVQAISDTATGVTAANFFAAGTAGPITVSAPCSVLLRESGGQLKVSVADPTRTATTITVTINRGGYATASGDPQVSVIGLNPVTLVVETGGSLGASRTITLGTGAAVTGGALVTLAPTADAHVRDGSYATTNFNGNTLEIKNDGTGYARRAYLKFDLSGLASAPKRAVLWVSGNTADSIGTHTTISAYAVAADSWSESTVTWNTAPALGAQLSTAPLCQVADWIPLDVTSFARAEYAGDKTATVGLWQAVAGRATIVNSRTNTTRPAFLQVVTG